MNSIDYMKLAAFQELKEVLETKRMNDDLLEYLASSLRFILRYCKKHNLPMPESDKILDMIMLCCVIPSSSTHYTGKIIFF